MNKASQVNLSNNFYKIKTFLSMKKIDSKQIHLTIGQWPPDIQIRQHIEHLGMLYYKRSSEISLTSRILTSPECKIKNWQDRTQPK